MYGIAKHNPFALDIFKELERTLTPGKVELPIEIENREDKYIVKAEVPGVDKENIEVTLENGVLTISAEKKEEKNDKHYSEFSYGKVVRSFTVENVNEEEVSAEYKDGILKIEIPKENKKEVKKIEVK